MRATTVRVARAGGASRLPFILVLSTTAPPFWSPDRVGVDVRWGDQQEIGSAALTAHRPARRHVARPAALLVAAVAAVAALTGCGSSTPEAAPTCTLGSVRLDPGQMQNASTIAAVGRRLGLPDHAVTVALATALQESKLRNLPYGDRDSLGLFQQRPSQGWGSPSRIQTPRLAAAAFYRHLTRVPAWQALSVTAAAQRVQRSALPDAYGQWEDVARELARGLTGQSADVVRCAFRPSTGAGARPAAGLRALAVAELGPGGLGRTGTGRVRVATGWLVAHSAAYGVTRVSVAGRTWTASSGSWKRDPRAGPRLTWR